MIDAVAWFFTNLALAPWHIVQALMHPGAWLDWSEGAAVMRFAYFGGSVEFFFAFLFIAIVLTVLGLVRPGPLWAVVRGWEWFANGTGRLFAWAGLLMVLQQTLIVFLQRIFLVSEISIGPFGSVFTRDLSWYSEELKLYNAMVVALCCAYTFVQGGHVRVDLVYGAVSRRTKKIIDMAGALIFMVPVFVLTWMYAWYFLWRHLVTPKVSASDSLQMMERKGALFRWNVETIGFSPSGFDAYFLFKVLIVAFLGMMLVQAVVFFWRNMLELREGPEADARHHDPDRLDDGLPDHPAETM